MTKHAGPASGRIAYVTSTFPLVSETFILREIVAVERGGIPLLVFSIRRRPSQPVHADALPYLDRTIYAPWFGFRHVLAFMSLVVRRPRGVVAGLMFLLRDMAAHARFPANAAKTLLAAGKMFLYTRQMERAGVIHIHAHYANIATTHAAFTARVLGITYSFTGHAWDIFVPVNQAGLHAKIAGARFVLTCTDFNVGYMARFARSDADRARIERSYHGVDVARYAPAAERDSARIISGGRLHAQKGLTDLVEAAALLRTRAVDFHIEIVGEGEEKRKLEAAIARHGLERFVSMVGSMPHEKLMDRIRTSAMVVLPCIETRTGFMDGIPNLLIESLALAVPVISTRLSGIPELVVEGETGVLIAPGDVRALADAIESLIRDPDRGVELGRNGRARVLEQFDLEKNTREIVGRYRRIMAGANRQ